MSQHYKCCSEIVFYCVFWWAEQFLNWYTYMHYVVLTHLHILLSGVHLESPNGFFERTPRLFLNKSLQKTTFLGVSSSNLSQNMVRYSALSLWCFQAFGINLASIFPLVNFIQRSRESLSCIFYLVLLCCYTSFELLWLQSNKGSSV